MTDGRVVQVIGTVVDVEFLGNQPRRVQLNFWTNDDTYTSRNEVLIDLGWDPAAEFHRYGFKWTATGITWYVDGTAVYAVADSAGDPTPKASDSLQKIMLSPVPKFVLAAVIAIPLCFLLAILIRSVPGVARVL